MLIVLKESIVCMGVLVKKSAAKILFLLLCLFVNIYFFLPNLEELRVNLSTSLLIKLMLFLIIYAFIYVLTLLIVGYELLNHNQNSFIGFCKSRWLRLFTDLTKAYNQILLLGLLLILPGVYKYIRLIFVPFVSMEMDLDKTENKDHGNSLDISQSQTKNIKVFFGLLLIFLIFSPLDFIWEGIDNNSIENTLLFSVLSLSPIYYHCLVLCIYKKSKP